MMKEILEKLGGVLSEADLAAFQESVNKMISEKVAMKVEEKTAELEKLADEYCEKQITEQVAAKTQALSEKYEVARLVGRLNKMIGKREKMPTILLGPGRWGTTTPAMGVPVTFSEINNITAIGEIAYNDGSLVPDLSFGTHFFQDMVEMDIFYVAIYPGKKDVIFNLPWLIKQPNILTDLMPDDEKYKEVVRVYDVRTKDLRLLSDIVTQKMICFSNK